MADTLPHAGTKRPHSSSTGEQQVPKKRRVRHSIRHTQHLPNHVEPAPQDPAFAQNQLLRSLTAALVIAGFDSAEPAALEMLRSHTESYMMRMGSYIQSSMQAVRRTKPTAQDFSTALSLLPNASSASLLKPQLSLRVPETISYPSIAEPDLPEPQAPNFSALLQPLTTSRPPSYIPKHFPPLPPRHSWMQTPVYPEREKDARKMREKATQEGMMAEQALRRLATAAKAGALKAEKKRSSALGGPGKARHGMGARRIADVKDSFADAMQVIGGVDADGDLGMGMDGANDPVEDGIDTGMPEGVVVNYDMGHWRHGGSRKSLRL